MQRKLTKKKIKNKRWKLLSGVFCFFLRMILASKKQFIKFRLRRWSISLDTSVFFYPSYARINSPDLCLWMSKELLTCWQFFPSLPHWSSTGDTDISGSGWLQTVEMVWTAAFRSSHPHESSLIIAELWTRLHEKHLPWLHHLHEFI